MAVLKLERRIKAHPELVWQVIADIGGLAEVAPHVSKVEILSGEKVGLKRRVYDRRGQFWEEECIAWVDDQSYSMRVNVSHYPFDFAAMEFTWSVEQLARNTLIKMRYEFVPKFGLMGLFHGLSRYRKKFEETCKELLDNLVRKIHTQEWVYHVTVDSILRDKGHDIITVKPDTLVIDTAHILRENRIGCVLAMSQDGQIAGVVSERDIVRGLSEVGLEVMQHPVSEIMSKQVVVCHPRDNMATVLSLMTNRRIRHLPVMHGEELIGIISIGDVVKTRINELEDESISLRTYISGRQWLEHHDRFGPDVG